MSILIPKLRTTGKHELPSANDFQVNHLRKLEKVTDFERKGLNLVIFQH